MITKIGPEKSVLGLPANTPTSIRSTARSVDNRVRAGRVSGLTGHTARSACRREDLVEIRARSLELARDQLGLVFKKRGSSWKALCPFHQETTPSFDYREDTHTFLCFGCGWAGGDIFALFAAMRPGARFIDAVVALGRSKANRFPTSGKRAVDHLDRNATIKPPAPHCVAPADAPEPPRHWRCVGRWRYADSEDRTLGYQDRINDDTGKRFTSWRWNDSASGWEAKAIEKPRPLYGLPNLFLRPDAPVLVCEGERTADAARETFPGHVCVTSMGGSAAPRSTDWSPLRHRSVRLWPDNDAAGYRYACGVAAILATLGTPLLVVRPAPSLSSGWDLADPWPEGTGMADLRRLLSEAQILAGEGR